MQASLEELSQIILFASLETADKLTSSHPLKGWDSQISKYNDVLVIFIHFFFV